MNAVKFFVIRHGKTDWNAEGRIQGNVDTPLNTRGDEQARAVARALADMSVGELWSSDLARATQTGAHVSTACNVKLKPDKRLRERHFGVFQGLTYEECLERHPRSFAAYRSGDPSFVIPQGESGQAFFERVVAFFQERAKSTWPGSHVAVITHGGVINCLYRFVNKKALTEPRTWPIPNCGINEFIFENNKWSMGVFADTAHLSIGLEERFTEG